MAIAFVTGGVAGFVPVVIGTGGNYNLSREELNRFLPASKPKQITRPTALVMLFARNDPMLSDRLAALEMEFRKDFPTA